MMSQDGASVSAPDRLDRMEKMLTTMLETTKATRTALAPLYAVLTRSKRRRPISSFTGLWAWAECNDMSATLDVTGPGWNTAGRDLNLLTDNVKSYFDRWLPWQGNPPLRLVMQKRKTLTRL
jgi:hypothetical protein